MGAEGGVPHGPGGPRSHRLRGGAALLVGLVSAAGLLAGSVAECQTPDPGGASVPVAARAIPRGAVLEPKDIAFRSAPGEAATDEELAGPGWVTRRVVAEGELLRPPAVAPPLLVRVGQEVQLVWRDGPLELRLSGRAMNAAGRGERVTVRIDAKRRFEGVAVAAGLVRLEPTSRSR